MWLLGVLLCLCFNLTSAKVGEKCTTEEAKNFIESSSGRKVAFLQQFPQDGTCRVKFSDSSRYYVCNYVCMYYIFLFPRLVLRQNLALHNVYVT